MFSEDCFELREDTLDRSLRERSNATMITVMERLVACATLVLMSSSPAVA